MRLLLSISLFAAAMLCNAQVSRLGTDVTYAVEGHVETSDGDYAPFWFSNNKYGLSTLDPHSGYVRASVKRAIEADSTRQWAIGYGADLAVSHNHPADFVIQQLYGEAKYKGLDSVQYCNRDGGKCHCHSFFGFHHYLQHWFRGADLHSLGFVLCSRYLRGINLLQNQARGI